jgi:hypothetical protein
MSIPEGTSGPKGDDARGPGPVLLVVGQIGAAVMAVSLFLPWLTMLWESRSYLSLSLRLIEALNKTNPFNGTPGKDGEGLLCLALFAAPAAATVIGFFVALDGLGKKTDLKGCLGGLAFAGVVGLVGAGGFYYLCSRVPGFSSDAFGSGYFLFAVASLVVLGAGAAGAASEEK